MDIIIIYVEMILKKKNTIRSELVGKLNCEINSKFENAPYGCLFFNYCVSNLVDYFDGSGQSDGRTDGTDRG